MRLSRFVSGQLHIFETLDGPASTRTAIALSTRSALLALLLNRLSTITTFFNVGWPYKGAGQVIVYPAEDLSSVGLQKRILGEKPVEMQPIDIGVSKNVFAVYPYGPEAELIS